MFDRAIAAAVDTFARQKTTFSKQHLEVQAVTPLVVAEECAELRIRSVRVDVQRIEVIQRVEISLDTPRALLHRERVTAALSNDPGRKWLPVYRTVGRRRLARIQFVPANDDSNPGC